jgi:hypothetical protein
MLPTLHEVTEFFLTAMAAGYATKGVKKVKIEAFPGSKAIPFEQGDFRLLDMWFVAPGSDHSTGMTTIWYKGNPVWVMHYGGWYDPRVIPFLKRCLYKAYVRDRTFRGGRGWGPMVGRIGNRRVMYDNHMTLDAADGLFAGRETITSPSRAKSYGYHWYSGGPLAELASI